MWNGSIKILLEVKYISDLKRNLISLGMMDKNGYCYKAENGVLKVIKGAMVVLKGNLHQGLYVLQGSTVTGEVSVTESRSDRTQL